MRFPHFRYCLYALSNTTQNTWTQKLCHVLCRDSLSNKVYVLKVIFMYFSACYMQVLLPSFFWMTLYSVSCPTEVSKSSKRLNYYSLSVFCYLHTQTLRLRYGTLCTPCTGNLWEGGTPVWALPQFGSKPLFIWSGQMRL